ncbi:PBECR2 nuclease fold domain-containing protein [Pseudomonas aeruginosa]|uniref:PBECR2 nuclease fold domain-containing protein n=1 Tax=Pseudomonas aeruginosa TaxID=287 RepID=UPI0019116C5A|nr:PBECR2 nuclease fold domain-containing protein [Pseudomonas aeruginosa]
MALSHGSLPFKQQITFFRDKVNLPTRAWSDLYAAEHDWAFVVAGATKRTLLADLRGAVQRAIESGQTLEQFRQNFDQVVAKHGWQYNGERGWRTRVIFDTNLRQSYNAGRETQMADPLLRKRRPYGLYRHGDSRHPRPQHLAWDGTVLPLDDPWWSTHSPQNGWGCQCKKFMLSERDLQRMGLAVGQAPEIEWEDRVIGQNSPNGPRTVRVPKGIDPGFEYAPGQSRLSSAVPPLRAHDPLPEPTPGSKSSATAAGLPNTSARSPLPTPRQFPAKRLLPAGRSEAEYVSAFLGKFGATEAAPAVFRDVTGDAVVIGRELFVERRSSTYKVLKRGREQQLPLLAEALKSPDEVWVRVEWLYAQQRAVVRRRYISRFAVEGQEVPALAVFEVGDDGWAGVTTFSPEAGNAEYLERLRIGVRLYRRES